MELFTLFSILITLSAFFSYCNHRFLKLPSAIGLMVLGLLMSLLTILIGSFIPSFEIKVEYYLREIDFSAFLLDTLLCFMLFAGALHVKLPMLLLLKRQIASYATLGVVVSTFTIGILAYWILPLTGITLPYLTCLLFGALISPTDPIAVMGILTKANIPKKLETEIVGESLFNDGTGVVAFLTLLELIHMGGQSMGGQGMQTTDVILLILQEVGGGLLLGGVIGYTGFLLLRSIDHYQTEVLLTLALVMGGYSLAAALHFSGPLAMVLAGLLIGNQGRQSAMSEQTTEYIDKFWELIDEILNALLFVLIGLEFLLVPFEWNYLLAGILMILIVLVARFIAVGLPLYVFNRQQPHKSKVLLLLTWGGLRGGISVALALMANKQLAEGNILIVITYIVVLFSILVQGLSIEKVIKALKLNEQ